MFDVVVVGAGPVGLFLGALLLQEGLSVRILEQRTGPSPHSRAIGIHPPALAALEQACVAAQMVAEAVQIGLGIARSAGTEVARLSFATLASHYPYVLTLPQARTEALLEARLHALDPAALVRGFCVSSMHDAGTFLTLSGSSSDVEAGTHFQARLVVGADGARSAVRRLLGIPTSGRDYPDTYLMGDFPDTGPDGSAAILYLEPGGILESFPLPGGLRRWVAHTDSLLLDATAADLARIVSERSGVSLEPQANRMLSAFAVRTRLARHMIAGRVALVGDAAHEISPIGGQGMNLGWLDAAELAPIVVAALAGKPTGTKLAAFEKKRMRAARTAARQAQLNMVLGRKVPASYLQRRNAVLGRLVRLDAVHNLVARRFTMHSLR
ncbi:NAD(P)/FAD-dependent oxidoreductase [Specibacter sp. NPDC078692]|uniref:FAD-dependent oxidoreductase n=1 Tax=Specibacter sp. NPDC078692 TaxID=3155818 RepID=UPI00341B7C8C